MFHTVSWIFWGPRDLWVTLDLLSGWQGSIPILFVGWNSEGTTGRSLGELFIFFVVLPGSRWYMTMSYINPPFSAYFGSNMLEGALKLNHDSISDDSSGHWTSRSISRLWCAMYQVQTSLGGSQNHWEGSYHQQGAGGGVVQQVSFFFLWSFVINKSAKY